jgi:hypothetical protein
VVGVNEALPGNGDPAVQFRDYARSRPAMGELAAAFQKLWALPKAELARSQIAEALEEVCDLYRNQPWLELHIALLPAVLHGDTYAAVERLEGFVARWPDNLWGYLRAIQLLGDVHLYDRMQAAAAQTLERLDTLRVDQPEPLYQLLLASTQLGNHPLVSELLRRLRALDAIPSHSVPRFAAMADNLKSNALEPIEFISLGSNGVPWIIPNRWGLRRAPGMTRHELPFNLGLQTPHSCLAMLADRLANLANPAEYVLTPGQHAGVEVAMHKSYRFMFNHEIGPHWTANAYENLVTRYRERVANFFRYAVSGPRVYVLYLPWPLDVAAVERNLAEMAEDEDYRLLVIDTCIAGQEPTSRDPRTLWRKVALPPGDYVWHVNYDTREGVAFESSVHDALRDSARQLASQKGRTIPKRLVRKRR